MNIVELFARIGLKTDEDKAKSFHRVMNTVKIGLIATTAVAAGTAVAIRKITSEAMTAAVAFKQFETETGASAQQLQKWQSVAEQTNQSAESVTSAIKSIVSNQEKIKLGQGDISGFQILGIDPRQDPFKILEELRTKTKGLSDGMKKNILSQMGVGSGLLQTISLTRKEFDEMAGRAWIISPQAIETLNKTKSAVDLAARSVKYMKSQIAVGLSPQIRKLAKDSQEWMKVNEKGIIEGFKKGFKFVNMFVKAVYNAGSMIDRVVSSTVGWDMAVKGLLGVFLLLNSALLFSPIGLIVAGIVLLVAVLDDLYVYSQGGKSLFGNLMKEFPALEKSLFGSFKVIRDVFKLMKEFISGNLSLKDLTADWGSFGEGISYIYDKFVELKNLFKNFKLPKWIEDLIDSEKLKIEVETDGGKRPKKSDSTRLMSLEPQREKTVIEQINSIIDFKPFKHIMDKPVSPVTPSSNNVVKTVSQTNNIDINITATGEANAIGDAVAKSLQRSINAASAQFPGDQ